MKRATLLVCFGVLVLAIGSAAVVVLREPSLDDIAMPADEPLWAAPATSWDPTPDALLYQATRSVDAVDRLVVRVRPMDPRSGKSLSTRSATITGPAVGEIVGAWRRLRAAPALGCITPGYELEFYAGKRFISSVELSYGCSNVLFDHGRRVEGFDANGETGVALRQSLDRALGLGKVVSPTGTGPN